MHKKVFVIGLDCATPQLLFDEYERDLPNITKLRKNGVWCNLRSTIPPITVPAWTSMMTSKDPGQLGFYGFRNRSGYNYDGLFFANGSYVKEKTIWNYLSRNKKISILLGIPQTYPPKPLNGIMVSCFLTPDKNCDYTYPPEIKYELDRIAEGDYIIDVKDFRTDNKKELLEEINKMTRRRFLAVRHFLKTRDWDFFMFVEMGVDRIHHGFWRYCDRNHRLFETGNPYEYSIKDYYKMIDDEIGRTVPLLPENTTILIVSDHGARTMEGAICVNEFFIREGLLKLKEPVKNPVKLTPAMVDWKKTSCWGEGGYYSRIFMNVKGREPEGIIPPERYEEIRSEIKGKLEAIPDEKGNGIGTVAYKPEEIYKDVRGIPPDLIVLFGNLAWRSAGSVGTGKVHTFENDTGPDDANHAQEGIFIANGNDVGGGEIDVSSIYDIAPTILSIFDIPVPSDMIGKKINLKRQLLQKG